MWNVVFSSLEFESLLLCKAGIVIEGDAASKKTCGSSRDAEGVREGSNKQRRS
jgi:hypothetical protein